jgi:DNA helicase-2/ATP-dependent DNA helicase PcrA
MTERYHATLALERISRTLRENPAQWTIFNSTGNQVVLAGPGSGKTHVITAKVARLLAEEVWPPQAIACLTYNNECVREFRSRLKRLGISDVHNVVITTVHGFCLRHILAPFARLADPGSAEIPEIASEQQRQTLMKESTELVLGANRNAWAVSQYEVAGRVSRHRVRSLSRSDDRWMLEGKSVRAIINQYEASLKAAGLIDFEMMVLDASTLVRNYPWVREILASKFPIIVVDEYQDLGVALDDIIVSLVKLAGLRLIAVGDPDQSIYGFTGTDPSLLRDLAGRIGTTAIPLRFNYRSGREIIRASTVALGEIRDYEARSPQTGSIHFHNCSEGLDEQATLICRELIPAICSRNSKTTLGSIAVLYASHKEGTSIAHAAGDAGIAVQRVDNGAPYPKTSFSRWLEDCAAWCATRPTNSTQPRFLGAPAPTLRSLVSGWTNTVLMEGQLSVAQFDAYRLALADALFEFNDPSQPIAPWLIHLQTHFVDAQLPSNAFYEDIRAQFRNIIKQSTEGALLGATVQSFSRQVGDPDVLNLLTLYSAKGLEFDSVVLMGLDEGVLPRWNAKTREALVEARRLFYVGITRARHEVHITYSGFTENNGRRFENGPSRFVLELEARLTENG